MMMSIKITSIMTVAFAGCDIYLLSHGLFLEAFVGSCIGYEALTRYTTL